MASDNLSLLFRFRGDASGIRSASAEARQAVQQIKQSFGPELTQALNVTNAAFNQVGADLANLATQRVPIVNAAVTRLTDVLRGFGVESKTTERAVNNVATSIASIAQQSGRSIPQVTQFLTRYVQLGDQAKKNEAAFKEFGGSVDLIGNKTARFIPELEKAGAELGVITAQASSAGGSIGAMAGPIGIAVIALAAMVAALVLAGNALFDLSRRTAEFQGRMQDLSQATGLAVETLSALEVAAKTTGGSLDGVAASIGIFQRQLEEAEDPTSKAADLFERLNVQVADTETTLRASLAALARLPEGFEQTALALQLFGRGGRQVLAILKETNGDLDALQRKLAEAGILISTGAARAADQFNDELALLEFQLRALGAAAVTDLIPALTELIKSLAEVIRAVQPVVSVVGKLTELFLRPFPAVLRAISQQVKTLTLDFDGLREAIKKQREEAEKARTIPALDVPAPQTASPPQKSAEQQAREDAQLTADALSIARRNAQQVSQALREQFEQGRINREQEVAGIIEANGRVLRANQDRIDAEIQAEEQKFKEIRDRRDLSESERIDQLQRSEGTIRKLQQERLDAEALFEITKSELRSRAAKERADSLRNEERNNTEILLGEIDRQIRAIEAGIEAGTRVEEDGLRLIEQLEQSKVDARRASLEEQKRIGVLTIQNQKDIDAQIRQLDQEADRLREEQEIRRRQRERERAARSRQFALDEIQTLLELERIKGESIIAAIQAQAALRIRSEESAAREILRIRLQLIDDELEALRTQEKAATSITNREERLQRLAELNAQIRILSAERAAVVAQGAREVEDARQVDLRNDREYAEELREIQERILDVQRDTAREAIRLLIISGARRRDIIRAQRDLELAEESERHRRRAEDIRDQQRTTEAEIRALERRLDRLRIGTTEEIEEHDRLIESLERLRAKRAELEALKKAEDERTAARGKAIKAGAAAEEEAADPFGRLRVSLEEIRQITQEIESVITPLNETLKRSFLGVADAIGQTVANYVLLGTTGPAVMRKILAQALASIAAEATVNAIKETALGFASLFFNPAEAAAHFTSAGLWASIAGATALAGRGIAGDLFQPQGASGAGAGAGGGTGGRQQSQSTSPIDQTRTQQQREELHIFVHAEEGPGFERAAVRALVHDISLNGDSRTAIVHVTGG